MEEDAEWGLVAKAILKGWPDKERQIPDNIKQYWTFREQLSYVEGLIQKCKIRSSTHTEN